MPFPTDLRHFRASEFSDPDRMDLKLLRDLDQIRSNIQSPIIVSSSFRPDLGSAHSTGHAVDITDNPYGKPISSRWRFKVLKAAFTLGLSRIGIYDRHIHLDNSEYHDQEVCWTGESD